jgi:hypothetical protein
MKLFILSLFVYLISCTSVNSQVYTWTKTYGGTQNDRGYSVYSDPLGNIYSTGYFSNTSDFDPGPSVLNLSSLGGLDIFIQKLDAAGNLLWAKSIGGSSTEEAFSIKTDIFGNVYTVGYFNGSVDFDPGSGTDIHTSLGGPDAFILKMDSMGNFVWAKTFGGAGVFHYAQSIDIDSLGNIYTSGYFTDTVDFDPGFGTFNITSAGSTDIFILKLNVLGNFIWAKSFGGSNVDASLSSKLDGTGNLVTTGYFGGTVDFDPGTGTANSTSLSSRDVFILKIDPLGNYIWSKTFGGNNTQTAEGVEIDLLGNIYVTGYFKDTVDFDPGSGSTILVAAGEFDIFIQKMDSMGNFIWAKSFGGLNDDFSISTTTDALGNVYTTGSFGGSVDLDPGVGIANFNSFNGDDVFIQKLDAAGNFLWAESFGGSSNSFGSEIIVDASNNIYTIGFFEGTVDFDPSPVINNLASVGQSDIFIHKMSQITTNLTEFESKVKILASPNPTTGIVTIISKELQSKMQIELYDSQSRMVFSKEITGYLNEQINITGSSGIYFLKIITPNDLSILKVIKK